MVKVGNGPVHVVESAADQLSGTGLDESTILDDGQIELGFRGDDEAAAQLLTAAVGAGLKITSFARAASDLEELFLQVTAGSGGNTAQVA